MKPRFPQPLGCGCYHQDITQKARAEGIEQRTKANTIADQMESLIYIWGVVAAIGLPTPLNRAPHRICHPELVFVDRHSCVILRPDQRTRWHS